MTVGELWIAIRRKYLACICGQPRVVRLYPVARCPLWPYQRGKNYPPHAQPKMAEFVEMRSLRRPENQSSFQEEPIAHVN